jgi:hypothetical protein
VDQKTSQYLVWPPFASCSATHLLHLELIRLLIVACGMLTQSFSMAVQSCWILAGIGTRCRTHLSRASQTCSIGDMSIQSIPNIINRWHVYPEHPKHAQWVTCISRASQTCSMGDMSIQSIPNMLNVWHVYPEHPKHAQWVTCLSRASQTCSIGGMSIQSIPNMLNRWHVYPEHPKHAQ